MLVKFRLKSLLMSVIVIIGLLAFATPFVYASDSMKTSEKCIKLIKELEGFAQKPYFDYSQWSVGYGTACNEKDYPNSITKAEADELMRAHVATLEKNLQKFIKNNDLKLTRTSLMR